MDWIESQFSHAPIPSAIVHLGAGVGQEVQHYIRCQARRIILIEPNPEVLSDLRRQAAGHANVEVLPVGVAAEEGRCALKLYNYPDLASLRRPTGLTTLLPGLQQTGQSIVDVMAAHDLPEKLELEDEEDNWLIIDTPGEEAAIIADMAQYEQLYCFGRIIIRAGSERLYDGAQTSTQITGQLEQLGYFVEGAPDTTDRDWPRYHLRLNPKAIECRRLRQEQERLVAEKNLLEKRHLNLSEEFHEFQEQAKHHAQELEQSRGRAEARSEELESELQSLKEKFDGQLRDNQSRIDQINEQLESERLDWKKQRESLAGKLDELEQSRSRAEARSEELESELQALRKNFDKLTEDNRRLQSYNESYCKELESVRDELQQRRSDVSIALKLQNLRENDLRELQERYGQLAKASEQKKELLAKLHQRLSIAADYLRLSRGQRVESDEWREDLERALTGTKSED